MDPWLSLFSEIEAEVVLEEAALLVKAVAPPSCPATSALICLAPSLALVTLISAY